ncbi:biotin--[acetyl-CoA-carboxylase] ligase [Thalassococcus sp. BH17M4-6]|uniref:biotin--[acetyl-CoA-carboxylase] ligase n=1 Tax=Thalassococcus sp. BH17M4-6 TaxID=3413148 RepID=UPI003BC73ADE
MTMPAGYAARVLDEVDSTNAEAARLSAELTMPTWILARRQTAARGRRGRPWRNPEGNFSATLLMWPSETPDVVAQRSFVAALALHEALVEATGRTAGLSLKWPNDVLLNGGKVAGILLESLGQRNGVQHLAIGVGVNLLHPPPVSEVEPDAVPPVALMSATGVAIDPEAFLDLLAQAYAKVEALFVAEGFAPIRQAWLLRAAKLGEVITARTGRSTATGKFDGVDMAGNLVLITADGRLAIPAADVFF